MNTLTIDKAHISQDSEGRYCLNDLHRAAGGARRHGPSLWLDNRQTKELVAEIAHELADTGIPVSVIRGGVNQGSYVCRELVYAYAMWISPEFHLKVIRVFDAYQTKGMVMKPEVAKQAFDDPKVFMAKALMLAQAL